MPEVVNKYKLRAEAGRVYSDDLELVFAELPTPRTDDHEQPICI